MSFLIMNLSKSIHQGNTGVASKQLSAKRLKLISKLSQEVIHAMKLKSGLLIHAQLTSGRKQLRTKSVDLTPNSRQLIEESINGSITLTKKLLLMNSNKKSRLFSGLIVTTKKSPHLMSPLKL
jgi:kynureninase